MRVAITLILLLGSVLPGIAQTNTGELSGVVRDIQGGLLAGVTVVAEHAESGVRIERLTDSEGRFFLPSLRVGPYTISAALAGFKRTVRSGVIVQLGQALTLISRSSLEV